MGAMLCGVFRFPVTATYSAKLRLLPHAVDRAKVANMKLGRPHLHWTIRRCDLKRFAIQSS
jgi:hypothetical protein